MKSMAIKVQNHLSRWAAPALLFAMCCALAPAAQAQPAWQKVKELNLPQDVMSLDWHPDGRHVAVTYPRELAQVWNVDTGQGLQTFGSTRWGTTQSGKEIGFSPDGKYLVVQDVKRNRPEDHPYPRTINDPLEKTARQDKTAFQIGRILAWPSLEEVTKIMGPGAKMYSAQMNGFCWTGGKSPVFAVHRNAAVALYSFPQGKLLDEVSILNPYPKYPGVIKALWWRMVCDPVQPRVAVQGALINDEDLKALNLSAERGPTPIAIVDLTAKRLERTLITHDALNGIVFTADGRFLVAYGLPPMQVWDAQREFAVAGSITEPNQKTGTMLALQDDWIAGMSDALHIWRVGTQQKASQDQALPRFSWRTAYHAPSQTLAVARGNTLTLYRLQAQAVKFARQR
jgi:hypothetical protein